MLLLHCKYNLNLQNDDEVIYQTLLVYISLLFHIKQAVYVD